MAAESARAALELARRRAQAEQACARGQDFQALTAAAMDACCPATGGGHRRSLQASCSLPATCPSAGCATVFVPFMADCDAMLSTVPGLPIDQYRSFAASCGELMLCDARPAMSFHVLVMDEGAAQACSRHAARSAAAAEPSACAVAARGGRRGGAGIPPHLHEGQPIDVRADMR